MSRRATELFEKAVKRSGYQFDMSRGVYGELLNKRTRTAWYFWYSAWQARTKDIKRKRKPSNASASNHE